MTTAWLTGRVNKAALLVLIALLLITLLPFSAFVSADSGNLALNKAVTASSYNDVYAPSNAVDGNASSYWESANNAGNG